MSGKVYNKKYRKIAEVGEGAYGKINLVENLEHEMGSEEGSQYLAIKKMFIDVGRLTLETERHRPDLDPRDQDPAGGASRAHNGGRLC